MSRGRWAGLAGVWRESTAPAASGLERANGAWGLGCFLGVAETTARGHGGNEVETAGPTPVARDERHWQWCCERVCKISRRSHAQPLPRVITCGRSIAAGRMSPTSCEYRMRRGWHRPGCSPKQTDRAHIVSLAARPWSTACIVSLPFAAVRDWQPLGLARLSRTPSFTLTLPGQLQCKRRSSPACCHLSLSSPSSHTTQNTLVLATHQQTITPLYNNS